MDTSWWVAFVVVVLLALVVTLADGLGRGVRGPRRRGRAAREPRPGEIWWARVPYEDGPGSKDRPCLVLSVRGDTAVVARISTRHHEERPGVIALSAGAVDDAQGRQSYLEPAEVREVAVRGFRRKAGEADPELWARIREQGEERQ